MARPRSRRPARKRGRSSWPIRMSRGQVEITRELYKGYLDHLESVDNPAAGNEHELRLVYGVLSQCRAAMGRRDF